MPIVLLFTSFVISVLATFLLVRYSWLHDSVTSDPRSGPQKFHTHQVSRIGGVAVLAAFAAPIVFARLTMGSIDAAVALSGDRLIVLLLACSLVAFAGGFAEDVNKGLSVRIRLFGTMLAAAMAFLIMDGRLDRVGVLGLDHLLEYRVLSLLFTMVAVGGIANAINIVDGYNGLSGMVVVFILGAMATVACSVGDVFVLEICLALIGAVLGFLVWNFPRGKIFLGDGGAYFLGFMVAELSVLLVRRHAEVSPWFPLMLVAYPVWETLYSIYRRKLVRGQSPGEPDSLHLHQIIFRRVVGWKKFSRNPQDRIIRNSLTSPFLWALSLVTIIPGVVFWDDTVVLAVLFFAFGFCYNWLYRRIVTFRVPKWLIIHRPAPDGEPEIQRDAVDQTS